MPSKYLEGKPILSSDMLLKSWNEFITNKFADQNCPREEIVSPEYHLDETELGMFESIKMPQDRIPIEAYQKLTIRKSRVILHSNSRMGN